MATRMETGVLEGVRRTLAALVLACALAVGASLLPSASSAEAADEEAALSSKTWEEIEPVLEEIMSWGVPYAYGGRSLTTGWDCSGFVSYVMYYYYGTDWPGGTWGNSGTDSIAEYCSEYLVFSGDTKSAWYEAFADGTIRPGDIVVFWNGSTTVHAAIVGDYNSSGKCTLYHALSVNSGTLHSTFDYSWADSSGSKYYDSYTVYRGLSEETDEVTVTFVKTSSNLVTVTGNADYTLLGAVYGVYSDEDCTDLVKTFTLDALSSDGAEATGEVTLDADATYFVKEISAPEGYALDETVYVVDASEAEDGSLEVALSDDPYNLSITLVKADSETGEPVEGAVFSIEGVDSEGSSIYSATVTTGSDGTFSLEDLALGTYTVTEVSAPDGYEAASGSWTLEFYIEDGVKHVAMTDPDGATETLVYDEDGATLTVASAYEIENDAYVSVTLTKTTASTDSEGRTVSYLASLVAGSDAYSLEGAVYALYADSACTTLVGTYTTDEDGQFVMEGLSQRTTYYLVEVSAPEGYALSSQTIQFTTSSSGSDSSIDAEEPAVTVGLDVAKVGENWYQVSGNGAYSLEGAQFSIYADEACTQVVAVYLEDGTGVTVFETDEDGLVHVEGLVAGTTYYLKEVAAPQGYELCEEAVAFTTQGSVTDDDVEVSFVDEEITVPIAVLKVGANQDDVALNSAYSLAGAGFSVYATEADAEAGENALSLLDEDGEAATVFYTDEDGELVIYGLFANTTYYVKEVVACEGHLLNDEVFEVTTGLDADAAFDELVAAGVVVEVEDAEILVGVSVSKVSGDETVSGSNSAYTLAGAVFEVLDSDGNAVTLYASYEDAMSGTDGFTRFETAADGEATVWGLYANETYYLHEVTAPKGYGLNEELVAFTTGSEASASTVAANVECVEEPLTVTVSFQKASLDPDVTDGNDSYSLEGAVYDVYWLDDSGEWQYWATIETDAQGAASLELAANTDYYIVETSASQGFVLDSERLYFTTTTSDAEIYIDSEVVSEVELGERAYTVQVSVVKYDQATGGEAQAGVALSGAVFCLVDSNGDAHYATSDDDGLVVFGSADDPIPLGDYTVYEVSAPEGYKVSDYVYYGTASYEDAASLEVVESDDEDVVVQYGLVSEGFDEPVVAFDLHITKYLDTGSEESGLQTLGANICFQVISNTTGEVVAELWTDENGEIDTEDQAWIDWCVEQGYLPEGTTVDTLWFGSGERTSDIEGCLPYDSAGYTVHEVQDTLPEGYEAAPDWQITADSYDEEGNVSSYGNQRDGVKLYYIVDNDVLQTRLQIVKVDADTGEVVPLAGFTFAVYDSDGEQVIMTDWYPNEETLYTFTTDESGYVTLPEQLTVGAYTIYEVSAESPYVLDDTGIVFYVTSEAAAEYPLVTAVYSDPMAKGVATVAKYSSYDGDVLAGVVFDVVAAQDVYSVAGTLIYAEGQVVDTVTTGEDGTATTCELYVGATGSATFYFVETQTVDGYALSDEQWYFTVSYADEDTEVVYVSTSAYDEDTQLIVSKTVAGTGEALAGVTFSYWLLEDEVDATGGGTYGVAIRAEGASSVVLVSDDGETVSATWDESQSCWIATGSVLGLGATYAVYVDGSEAGSLTVSGAGSRYFAVEDGELTEVVMLLASGADLSTVVTGEDGTATVHELSQGMYRIAETAAPEGYLVDTTIYRFKVDSDGLIDGSSSWTLEVEDEYTTILVYKLDLETEEGVSGAVLAIYDSDGELVEQWTTDGSVHVITCIEPGEYTLVEVSSPHSYVEASPVKFTVLETSEEQVVVMWDEPLSVDGSIDKKQEIADPTAAYTEEDGDGENTASVSVSEEGCYSYTIDFSNDSNTWVDEFTVTDWLEAAEDGLAYLVGVDTAQAFEDYDGLLNVWYMTNYSLAEGYVDASGANATTSDGHVNSWLTDDSTASTLGDDSRAADYTGWVLWAEGLDATSSTYLSVDDLDLEDGEYVIAIRFEYGRVEEGFTTREEGWSDEDLKSVHDDVDDASEANFNQAVLELSTEGTELATLFLYEYADGSTAWLTESQLLALYESEGVEVELTYEEAGDEGWWKVVWTSTSYETAYDDDGLLVYESTSWSTGSASGSGDVVRTVRTTVATETVDVVYYVVEGCDWLDDGVYTADQLLALLGDDASSALSYDEDAGSWTLTASSGEESLTHVFDSDHWYEETVEVEASVEDVTEFYLEGYDWISDGWHTAAEVSEADSHYSVEYADGFGWYLIYESDVVYDDEEGTAKAYSMVVALLSGDEVRTTASESVSSTTAGCYASAVVYMQVTDAYVEGTVLSNSAEVELYRNGGNLYDGDELEGHDEDHVEQTPKSTLPEISSELTDASDGDHEAYSWSSLTLVDVVSYEGVEVGVEHTVTGTLHLVSYDEDGNAVDGGVLTDADGEPVAVSVTFVPTEESGEVELTYVFDASGLTGCEVVAFAVLSCANDELGLVVAASHADASDGAQTVSIVGPEIGTQVAEGSYDASSSLSVVDEVSYEGLEPGVEYVVTGTLHLVSYDEEGDAVDGGAVTDADGDAVTATATFTPDSSSGTVEVVFEFDATALGGETVVVFESVALAADGEVVAVHEDPGDEGQTFEVAAPGLSTVMVEAADGDHEAEVLESLVLIETASYEGLAEGAVYALVGAVVDASTGEPVADSSGAAASWDVEFTATSADGEVVVEVEVDASSLSGRYLVAVERLYLVGEDGERTLVATHADLDDDDQTVWVRGARITTELVDAEDGDHSIWAWEEASLVDVVSYEGLDEGAAYVLVGRLVYADDGEPVEDADGAEVSWSLEFTADGPEGEVEVAVELDASGMAGRSVVAMESLYAVSEDGSLALVASHEDLGDEGQTVEVSPASAATTLTDAEDGDHAAYAWASATLVDRIVYEGLEPGVEHVVVGVLVDAETGEALVDSSGEAVTITGTFTPTTSSGAVKVTFAVDLSACAGRSLVAFEYLYAVRADGTQELVAAHEDLSDEAQTIEVEAASIGTTATDSTDGDHVVLQSLTASVTDTVSYEGLEPGVEHVAVGVLVVRSTGEALTDADGNAVTATATFTPESSAGTVEVVFEFDSSLLDKGEELVAFEYVSSAATGDVVASHEDIDDEAQTVEVRGVVGSVLSRTADGLGGLLPAVMLLGSVAGLGAAGALARRARREAA